MGTRTQHEASSSLKRWMHDVFLSFRGEDTRNGFTGHLYMTLKEAGANVFIDNQLRRGEEITAELVQAIRGSRISVVVFSKRYADSSWCLQELVEVMDCRRRLGQIVLPVFYDVDPSHVRKQTSGSFAQAFQKHEECFHEDTDKVARWRAALTEASNLSGWDLKNTANGHEAQFIRRIIGEITKQLDTTYLNVAIYQVGIDSRVNEINSLDGGSYDVQMVGIWGMGGMGKTSVAKAIYNKFYHSFVHKSFLANVREAAKESNGMTNLQEKLLSDIFKPTKMEVGDVHRGISLIKEKLRRREVLVIIDDVDHVDQLNALAINRDSFGRGSKIFITTRDRHLLEQVEVNIIYQARKMKEEEALELFSWHAFRNHCPNEEYVELTRSVLGYCGGLPLALEVLGSFLFKRSIRDWTSTLKKLEKIPCFKIQEKLKISFDALSDEDEREIFLDISCFFIGMDKNYVTRILEACGFFAEIGLSVLLQRCLVTVNEKNKLLMHDRLRDMGREIVRAKFPNHPGKCSRLWHQEDSVGVLTDKSGTEEIEGLALNLLRPDKASFSMKAFKKMKRLRLLQLNRVQLTGDYKHLSEKLRWLCWQGFPLKFIPKEALNQLRSLVSIDLRYSNLIQLWEHSMLLEKLKILNLSHSYRLTQSPNFSKLPNLEYLILKYCKSLLKIHHSIGCLERLALVNLKGCKKLKDLPKSFYKLKHVETLVLSGCSRFRSLVSGIGEMVSLKTLLIDNTAIEKVPYSSIARLKNLTRLSLCGLELIEPNPSVWPLVLTREYTPLVGGLMSYKDFRNIDLMSNTLHILPRNHKRKTTRGDGVIFPPGNDMAKWFTNVDNEGDRVCFQVPETTGSKLKSLTVCSAYSSSLHKNSALHKDAPLNRFAIFVTNHTKIISFIVRPMDPYRITSNEVIWQGHLSNKKLSLERGDSIEVYIVMGSGFRVNKTGVHLVWDPELINENVTEFESIPYAYFRSDVEYEAGPSHVSCDEDRSPEDLWYV